MILSSAFALGLAGCKPRKPAPKDGKPAPAELMRHHPFGRIAFANSDLSGIMDHRASITEAHRAVQQTLTFD